MHKIGAQICVCMFMDFRDKSLNMFQNVSGFDLQVAGSATNLILACCEIRLQITKCTVWPRNDFR